ncbi:MAG: trypsin-like peptidase domain-containing protein [Deltaproteobacteria bacterium]|nr:trypsin-like peptidase domain-containing protein [Deltaproteobacteria bacterium]MBW1952134.1 trypsin-like peptidase domain-containing protein [Deltaproteobacteria bacterium]MBW2134931.1 trypsin-like peptidase domain-containing protein [Deltaproteobacteria bacterium]
MGNFRFNRLGRFLFTLVVASLLGGCESQTESISQQVQKQPPTTIAQIVAMVIPAVVHIQAIQGSASSEHPSSWSKLFGFSKPFEDFGSSPAFPQRTQGSGFLIDSEGHVVTNHHLVHQAQDLVVTSWQGRQVKARLIGGDAPTDLSLLKLTELLPEVSYLDWGDSDQVQVGDRVLALGNPFGLENTVTIGIISAKGRIIGVSPYDDFLQTDAAINPGNSGGPLVNLRGEAVGISNTIYGRGQGIGFAIPSSLARHIVDQLKVQGRVVRGFLGVIVQEVTPELAASFGLKEPSGALVGEVIPETAAARGGVRRGDIILEFDGHQIQKMNELPRRTALTPIGKQVKLKVFRNGQLLALSLRVGEMPQMVADKTLPED